MGLVKLRCQTAVEDKFKLKENGSHADLDDFEEDENVHDDDSDSVELADTGCELCMVGDQVYSIPYELYSLPDLKEILSLETWNSCLTEEERFSLSAYLPDLDQQTYWLTMKELLTGKNMFLGSPLMEFFERLKGGFYHPQVTQFRECLKFLQCRAFFHSIKLYHENMGKTFSDMKRIWSKCQPNMTVEERIQIWNMWKKRKHIVGFDLNTFPADQPAQCIRDRPNFSGNVDLPVSEHVTKRVNLPPFSSGISSAPLKNSAKGVLKIKPAATSSSHPSLVCRPPPKGVLKIVPRGTLTHLAPKTSVEILGIQTCRPSPLSQPSCRWDTDDNNFYSTKLFSSQTVRNRKAHRSSDVPRTAIDQEHRENHNSTTGYDRNSASVSDKNLLRYVRKAKRPKPGPITEMRECDILVRSSQSTGKYAEENVGISGGMSEENPSQNVGLRNSEHYNSGEWKMTQISMYPGTSESGLRIPTDGVEVQDQTTAKSFNRAKESNRDDNRAAHERPPNDGSAIRDGTAPITYKRRKALTKVNTLGDLVKQPKVGTDFDSRNNLEANDRHPVENSKSVKIKLKNWRDPKYTGNIS
ncbi:uncharacterized protein [Aristolochia californica]|uniref:uncharacterized protein n=1 Tax=Aristolochia californica TaxID=171875 RepID=UPI0035D70540